MPSRIDINLAFIERYAVVFWDFDGVIKESLDVKTDCFSELFSVYGEHIQSKIRKHHLSNLGISRSKKIPLYLQMVGLRPGEETVQKYCQKFSELVTQRVVSAKWVDGVEIYLARQHAVQDFVLVTATPQKEIEVILEKLSLSEKFKQVFGAPKTKIDAIGEYIAGTSCNRKSVLLIGDTETDLKAASYFGIDFILRKTPHNRALQKIYKGPQMKDFVNG